MMNIPLQKEISGSYSKLKDQKLLLIGIGLLFLFILAFTADGNVRLMGTGVIGIVLVAFIYNADLFKGKENGEVKKKREAIK